MAETFFCRSALCVSSCVPMGRVPQHVGPQFVSTCPSTSWGQTACLRQCALRQDQPVTTVRDRTGVGGPTNFPTVEYWYQRGQAGPLQVYYCGWFTTVSGPLSADSVLHFLPQ